MLFKNTMIIKALVVSLVPLFVSGGSEFSVHPKSVKHSPTDLQPTVSQRKVQETVRQILGNYTYKKVDLDDSLSSKIWDAFLKDVDYNKMYFTEADIKKFEQHRYLIDDYLVKGSLEFPYEVYNLFLAKQKERNKFVNALLEKPFDFTVDESIVLDREKAQWAKTNAQLDEQWRKMIKSQALDLKLADKADSLIAKTIKNRHSYTNKFFEKFKSEQVFASYMNAFAEQVDPHTNYMSPASAEDFKIDMAQSLEGIGAVLMFENDFVKINEVVVGGPAYKGKQLAKDDRIIGVAQGDAGEFTDITGWTTQDAVKLIRGPKGTVVRLQVLPANAPVGSIPKEYRIVREKVKLEDQGAKSEVSTFKHNGKDYKLGVITIPMFYRDWEAAQRREPDFKSTTRDVNNFLKKFEEENVDGVVIDLRNNGGGSLPEAVSLTGLFIKNGPVVQQRESGGNVSVLDDKDENVAYKGPLTVLVNRFSASASEIFAGAIQDYKRGLIVGEQSFGKGTVQTILDLNQYIRDKEQLGQLKVTIAKFYRVTGSSTQHKGVTPDIEYPSAFSAQKYGESSMPNALEWDQIETSKFAESGELNAKLLSKLRENFASRTKGDSEFSKMKKSIEEYNKYLEKQSSSLQKDKRKEERDQFENLRKATKLNVGKADGVADLFMIETQRLLSEMVESTQGGSKKNKKKEKLAKL
jgi:carboxyl-terminal processing protease